ncbi:hypothetical protein PAXINDRAFT_17910 [Paxillus involutus ATCC 200175]|uniref:Uncharacterized protein n=1 Tax=Paxillus involutus ATCC 200175 TaxID=664439 RepID=A0A0C9T054_PAXIN|nr:hypothetical protein PAXINDRAFT_17910 [Paxillus involutus ATCC 200175]
MADRTDLARLSPWTQKSTNSSSALPSTVSGTLFTGGNPNQWLRRRLEKVVRFILRATTIFHGILGRKEDPIAFAICYLARETATMEWWSRDAKMLERNGINSAGHACMTTLEGSQNYQESGEVAERLLSQFDNQEKYSTPSEVCSGRFLKEPDTEVANRLAACIDQYNG